jgi:thiol-disulfide isomerase/thioredoxin
MSTQPPSRGIVYNACGKHNEDWDKYVGQPMPPDAPRQEAEHKSPPQRSERGFLAAWIGLGVVALVFLTYLKWRPLPLGVDGVDHPVVGERLTFLELEPLTGGGEPVSAADLQGKVTLINIWGAWCPPCAEEFPYLAAIYDKFHSRTDFQYLSVSYDDKPKAELQEATSDFLRRMRADHPTYHDPGAATLYALHAIGVEDDFPTTIVLDASGTIRGVWRGYRRSAMSEIEQVLGELLND